MLRVGGTKVIERLSNDLREEFPDMKGTSARNLGYMKSFAEAYPEFMQLPVAHMGDAVVQDSLAQLERAAIVQQPVAKLPWGQNVVIMEKVKEQEERFFYAQKALENNWSRNVLVHQIESRLYH